MAEERAAADTDAPPVDDRYCPSCGAPRGREATYCAGCGQQLRHVAQPETEVTVAARLAQAATFVLLLLGQVVGALLLLALEFTSGTQLLSTTALAGFLAYSVAAWMISRPHPLLAVLLMFAGGAGLFALLLVADSQGWLGA